MGILEDEMIREQDIEAARYASLGILNSIRVVHGYPTYGETPTREGCEHTLIDLTNHDTCIECGRRFTEKELQQEEG